MAVPWARKEVDQVNNAIFMYVSSLQDVGGRKVLLFSSVGDIFWRGDAEITTFVLVKESAEDGRRVEVWPGKLLVNCTRAWHWISSCRQVLTSTGNQHCHQYQREHRSSYYQSSHSSQLGGSQSLCLEAVSIVFWFKLRSSGRIGNVQKKQDLKVKGRDTSTILTWLTTICLNCCWSPHPVLCLELRYGDLSKILGQQYLSSLVAGRLVKDFILKNV